jgi:hypothetical protein
MNGQVPFRYCHAIIVRLTTQFLVEDHPQEDALVDSPPHKVKGGEMKNLRPLVDRGPAAAAKGARN